MEGVVMIGTLMLGIFAVLYVLDKIVPLPPSNRLRSR